MNKISKDKRQEIINQINQIPKYKSHYRRQENSDTEFLPPEMTLSLMYRKYAEEVQNPVRFATYKRIFYTNFNLKFKTKKSHLQCMR
jgi:methyltransferase-like protein